MNFNAEKAAGQRVVMLYGDETYLRERALESIYRVGEISKDDFDLENFDAGAADADRWISAAGTAPFLSDRRTVVVRHMYRSDPDSVRKEQLKALPASARLILVFDDEIRLDEASAKSLKITNGWKKLVELDGGGAYEFKSSPNSFGPLVKEAVSAQQKTITPAAIEALTEMSGGNASHALAELEKVFLYVGRENRITESDVRAVVVTSREYNVFKMIDSIVASQPAEALKQLQILVGSAQKAEEAAFRQILPMVSRQLRLLWQGRTCVEAKCQPGSAPDSVLRQFPEKPNLGKEAPFRQSSVMNAARRVSFAQLSACMSILSDTDSRLKGALASFSAMDTLERMVLDMCQVLRR